MNKFIQWYKSFRARYIVQKRREHEYAINRYYAHLIDPFFTKLVYDLNMTPNMVTVLAGLLGIGSAVAFGFEYWLLGAILLQLHHFMDGADGNLARLTNSCTPFGAKLDQFTDQLVRLVLFVTVAMVAEVSLWTKILFILTIYVDLLVVHYYVLPFSRKHSLIRARWKAWFLERGIIPGFDVFTIYFLISVCAVLKKLELLIYIVIILKNMDWLYRVWECWKTKYILTKEKRII